MSSCGGTCRCGSGCKCGNCKCGKGSGGSSKMYPDLSYTETQVMGVTPVKAHIEGGEMGFGAENGGCKCGPNCMCHPCNCK